jgi:hypothetical protein
LPLWIHGFWTEVARDARGNRQPEAHDASWPSVVVQGIACGAAFAAILVFRSTTSLDFIYFQF